MIDLNCQFGDRITDTYNDWIIVDKEEGELLGEPYITLIGVNLKYRPTALTYQVHPNETAKVTKVPIYELNYDNHAVKYLLTETLENFWQGKGMIVVNIQSYVREALKLDHGNNIYIYYNQHNNILTWATENSMHCLTPPEHGHLETCIKTILKAYRTNN